MKQQVDKKVLWLRSVERYTNEFDALEKKIGGGSAINDKENRREVLNNAKGARDTQKETWKKICEIRRMYKQIRGELEHLNAEDAEMSDKCLSLLEIFEERLSAFKYSMRSDFDALVVAEKTLLRDINALRIEIDSWAEDTSEEATSSSSRQITEEQESRNADRQKRDIERKAAIGVLDKKASL